MKKLLVISFLFFFTLNIFADLNITGDYSKGPLYGKNMYLPFFIYYNFPGIRATCGNEFELNVHSTLYITQDFAAYGISSEAYDAYKNGETIIRSSEKKYLARDYESYVNEFGASFNIRKNIQVGFEMRLVAYCGGFLDKIVEAFHSAFGFPNAGREYYQQDQIYVWLPNSNNIRFYLNEPAISFGDIDLWVKYNFLENKHISLAAIGAFKIPTGQMKYLSGSGYPDAAAGILVDYKPVWILSLYFQSGIVLPFDLMIPVVKSKPLPMYNGLIGIELNPLSWFSVIAQFNIKTSPIYSSYLNFSWNSDVDQMILPQTNLLVGCIFKIEQSTFQVYFEEDTFTNQGADWTINITFSQKIRFKR